MERSFGTDQDRLVKQLRLAKVKTMQEANQFLEKEYWPEWNERFARPLAGVTNMHRALTPQIGSGERVEPCRATRDQQRLHIFICRPALSTRAASVQAGMRGKSLRIELHLNGTLKGRFEGQYVELNECGLKTSAAVAEPAGKAGRKDHNGRGKSDWMEGFFEQPGPELWQAVSTANERK